MILEASRGGSKFEGEHLLVCVERTGLSTLQPPRDGTLPALWID